MKVRELMTSSVRWCAPGDSVRKAAQIMSELNVGAVPVVEGHRVVGMLTDRDIVLRAVAGGSGVDQATCGDCMTADVVSCSPDTDAHEAAELMARRQIRRLPVVEGERLVGICALGDMATVNIHVNEAGEALSSISSPSRPGTH